MILIFLGLCFSIAVATDLPVTFADVHYEQCGGFLKVNQLAISPMPIKLPGRANLTVDVNVEQSIDGNLEIQVEMAKKIMFFWTKVNCNGDFGSCHYNQACQRIESALKKAYEEVASESCPKLLRDLGLTCEQASQVSDQVKNGQCPELVQQKIGIPCVKQCPIPAFRLNLHDVPIDTPEVPPSLRWLASGEYRLEAKLVDRSASRTLGCIKLFFSLTT